MSSSVADFGFKGPTITLNIKVQLDIINKLELLKWDPVQINSSRFPEISQQFEF